MTNSFEQIFHEYYSPLCNFASKIISNPTDAEDIVQDLFIQFLENNKLESVDYLERYLLRATKFKCLDYLKKEKGKQHVDVLGTDSIIELSIEESEISESDIEPMLHYFTSKLPPKTREVFLLSRTSKLTYQEIADKTGTSKKTVENQMTFALKKIREILKENNFFSFFL